MPNYHEIAFGEASKAFQEEAGSRNSYAKMSERLDDNPALTEREVQFLAERDSFYISTVTPDGWPYVQHRGGPKGFIKVLDAVTFAMPDFSGNRQFVSRGNMQGDDRTALFFMDYPNKRRLKMFARVSEMGLEETRGLFAELPERLFSRVERGFRFAVVAYDWNCPQYITPRWTEDEVSAVEGL